MARARAAGDWERDVESARRVEADVLDALRGHALVSHVSDFTAEFDALDAVFRFEGSTVRVDVKEKRSRLSTEICSLWPEVPREHLLVVDETAYRRLLWEEGAGYLFVRDVPSSRWVVFGPWELALAPHRQFERRGDKGNGEFLKGKVLLDMRTAAASSETLDVDVLLDVVRRTRRSLRQVSSVAIPSVGPTPIVPKPAAPAVATEQRTEGAADRCDEEPTEEPGWGGLSAELVSQIRRRWGWHGLTPIQELAVPVLLRGANALLLAPTAGGKSEAALLPLAQMASEHGWRAPSILYLAPLKALLNDQLERFRRVFALTGGTAFAWHGEVSWDDRRAFLDTATDALLTTPESLELLLGSAKYDHEALLGRLKCVVIDEAHAFCGTPRGAQLASLLERIERFAGEDVQRVAMSATVGNPEDVLGWLCGSSQRDRELVQAPPRPQNDELRSIAYDGLNEFVDAAHREVAGQRALVFARSRGRAERLANGLAGRDVRAVVHHGAVAAGRRRVAEAVLGDGEVGTIVATSSLELGIDVGALDVVVHDGAPTGPSSYLQRLGRAGRRGGLRRMTFLNARADDLLLTLGVLARVRRGGVEGLPVARGARLVLGQQIVALAFENVPLQRAEPWRALRYHPSFRSLGDAVALTIDHLIATQHLVALGDVLVVGGAAHAAFGGRGFAGLLSTFDGSDGAQVVDEAGNAVGTVDWSVIPPGKETAFVLAGEAWEVVSVDRTAGRVVVRPTQKAKVISWRGGSVEVDRATWEAVREVLAGTDVPLATDEVGTSWLAAERRRWAPRLATPVWAEGGSTVVDAFAGAAVHDAVLRALGFEGAADGPSLRVDAPIDVVYARAVEVRADLDTALAREAEVRAQRIPVRFPALVHPQLLVEEAREFHVDDDGIARTLDLILESKWRS